MQNNYETSDIIAETILSTTNLPQVVVQQKININSLANSQNKSNDLDEFLDNDLNKLNDLGEPLANDPNKSNDLGEPLANDQNKSVDLDEPFALNKSTDLFEPYKHIDFTSQDNLVNLLLDYNNKLTDKHDNNFMDSILKINQNIFSSIKKFPQKISIGKSYIPLRMYFSDILPFKEFNEFDFTKLNGVINIRAPSGVGKSSIISSIIYAIHGRSSEFESAKDIVNKHFKGKLFTSIELQQEDNTYMIIRIRPSAYNNEKQDKNVNDLYNIKTIVKLLLLNKNTNKYEPYKVNIKDDEIEQEIINLFGEYEELENIFFMTQKGSNFLSLKTPHETMTYWMRYFNLQIFDVLCTKTEKEIEHIKKNQKELIGLIDKKKQNELINFFNKSKEKIEDLENNKMQIEEKIINIDSKIIDLYRQISNNKYNNTQSDVPLTSIKSFDLGELQLLADQFKHKINNKIQDKKNINAEKIKKMKEVTKLKLLYQNNNNQIDTKIIDLSNEIKKTKIQTTLTNIQNLNKKNNNYYITINQLNDEIIKLTEQLNDCNNLNEIQEYNEITAIIKNNDVLEEIKSLNVTRDNLKEEFNNIIKIISQMNTELIKLELQIKNYDSNVTKYNNNDILLEKYTFYYQCISRNGIPKILIQQSLDNIEKIINEILKIFSNVKIKFAIEEKTKGKKSENVPILNYILLVLP